MNRRIVRCGLLAGVMLLTLKSASIARTWTDDSGQNHVDGDFVSIGTGLVTLKTGDGKTIQIPLEKLSKADQDFIGKMNKPAPNANPFVEVPHAAGAPAPADPVARTQAVLTDFLKRLDKQIDEIAELDTKEKRDAAHEAMFKAFASELKAKSLTFRFTVEDVESINATSARLKIVEPVGTDGFDTVITTVSLPIRKSEATKINSGATLVLSGNCVLVSGGHGPFGLTEIRGGSTEICSIESSVSGQPRRYAIYLSGLKFHIDQKKLPVPLDQRGLPDPPPSGK